MKHIQHGDPHGQELAHSSHGLSDGTLDSAKVHGSEIFFLLAKIVDASTAFKKISNIRISGYVMI